MEPAISRRRLCSRRRHPHCWYWESISVEFSALPPGAKLHLFFELTYESGNPYYPEYALDLESGGCTREGPGAIPTPTRYFAPNGAVNHVVFSADRPTTGRWS